MKKKIMEILRQFFSEDNGNLSFIRAISFLVVSNIMVNWTYVLLKTGQWIAMDTCTIGIILTVIGGKVAQKVFEQRVEISQTSNPRIDDDDEGEETHVSESTKSLIFRK